MARPLRTMVSASVAIALVGFIAATSLSISVAELRPRWSLVLAPTDPYTLLALAREKLVELEALSPVSSVAPEAERQPDRVARLKQDINRLATKARQRAPLDPEALRLLGTVAEPPSRARTFMRGALALSKRNVHAAIWLLNDALVQGDYGTIVQMANIILSSVPNLHYKVMPNLATLAAEPDGRQQLAVALALKPTWRESFIRQLGRNYDSSDIHLQLFLEMKLRGAALTDAELDSYLTLRMRAKGSPIDAYNVWLQLLPEEAIAGLEPYRNFDFSRDPSGTPFDWSFPKSGNVRIELRGKPELRSRILALYFGTGRVVFGEISQIIFLRPGDYVFEGQQSGQLHSRRGMRWSIACIPSQRTLEATDQLMGATRGWQRFQLSFHVPDSPHCEAQVLKLYHDARSHSEQYATGELLFDSLSLSRR